MRRALYLISVCSAAAFYCSPVQAVDLKNCDTIKSVPDRMTCLHANTVLLNSAFEKVTSELRQAALPAGSVAYFNLDACPAGWIAYKDGRGRVTVGVNPSIPSVPPGSKTENGLSVRTRGEKDTGAEAITLKSQQIPSQKVSDYKAGPVETMQVLGDFRGYPAYVIPGRDPNTRTRIPIEEISTENNPIEPINNVPPFVVLLRCQKI